MARRRLVEAEARRRFSALPRSVQEKYMAAVSNMKQPQKEANASETAPGSAAPNDEVGLRHDVRGVPVCLEAKEARHPQSRFMNDLQAAILQACLEPFFDMATVFEVKAAALRFSGCVPTVMQHEAPDAVAAVVIGVAAKFVATVDNISPIWAKCAPTQPPAKLRAVEKVFFVHWAREGL